MSSSSSRLPALVCLVVISALIAGCGGGGGAGGPQPPTPPPVEIGPGPGPAASTIPSEPGISTVAARAVPLATSPSASDVDPRAVEAMKSFAADPPDTEAELEAVLTQFVDLASANPDDAAAQAGLAVSIAIAGIYNAGIDAGYAPADLLELLGPVRDLAPAQIGPGRYGLSERILALCIPHLPLARTRAMLPASDWPDLSDPPFSSVDVQIGLRNFALPAIDHAVERLGALSGNAPGPDVPLVEVAAHDRTIRAYEGDVRVIAAMLRLVEAGILQACAWQLEPGEWDWTLPLADRDADGDGLLTVEEYMPADPFLWRADCNNMQRAGALMRSSLFTIMYFVENRQPDSFIAQEIGDDERADYVVTLLGDIRTIISEPVVLTFRWSRPGSGVRQVSAEADLSRIWNAPVDDAKSLLPTLEPGGNDAWEALPRTAADFPDPTFGGIFPQPDPVIAMLTGGADYVTISYGSIDEFVLLDRR